MNDAYLTLAAIRYRLGTDRPYYNVVINSLRYVVVPDEYDGFGCDERGRIYVGEKFLSECEDLGQASQVLEHAINHVLRGHSMRLGELPNRDKAGLAACLEIGDDVECTLEPYSLIRPKTLGLDEGKPAEWYYGQLPDEPTEDQQCGSGSGGEALEFELGEGGEGDADDAGMSQLEQQMLQQAAAEAIREYMQQNPGTVPAGLLRWADTLDLTPKVPWQRTLAGIVGSDIAQASGMNDYTRRRPSRRTTFGEGAILRPSMKGNVPKIMVLIDTSGSMPNEYLGQAVVEIDSILRRIGVQDVTVVTCDAAMSTPERVTNIRAIKMQGGGGTDMSAALIPMDEQKMDCLITVTDGYTPWPASLKTPHIVVIIGDGPEPAQFRSVRIDTK